MYIGPICRGMKFKLRMLDGTFKKILIKWTYINKFYCSKVIYEYAIAGQKELYYLSDYAIRRYVKCI